MSAGPRHSLAMGSALRSPELDRRLRSHLKPTNKSWRVDETYIRVKGKWVYLYRAVDSAGAQHRFSALGRARCGRSQAVLSKGVVLPESPRAAGDQCGQESFLSARG